MTGVDYIDSAGLGMVALASGKLKESGGKLALVAPEGRVLQLLNLTQMNMIVKVCPTMECRRGDAVVDECGNAPSVI